MKAYIILFTLSMTFAMESSSQGEALRIKLKNSTTEEIPIEQIQKIEFTSATTVGEEDTPLNPLSRGDFNGLSLHGNNPNPFAEHTNIEFEIASQGNVYIMIYDNSGKQIQRLECNNCNEGKNSLQWNCLDASGSRVQSGVYYYEVHFGGEVLSKKMLVVK